VVIAACSAPAQTGDPGMRIRKIAPAMVSAPPQPTLQLSREFTPTHIAARLQVDPAQPTFGGVISIEGTLDHRTTGIWLHAQNLDIASATANDGLHDVKLTPNQHGDLLELTSTTPLEATKLRIAIAYRGKIVSDAFEGLFSAKLGGDTYLTTQFEAIAARQVFPCFDEPGFKVPWQLTLDVPKGQVAVSNTMPVVTPIDAAHERYTFAETRPLPSYLIAFAVGPFEFVDAGKTPTGAVMRVVTPKGTTKQVAFLASAAPKFTATLETFFGIPFPYPKLDFVVVPTLGGNAMENAGMIVSDSRNVLFDTPGAREQYNMISLFGHETAHQWFGDLVTAAWWDDIWLNESFASWIEDKVLLDFDKTWPNEVQPYRVNAFRADELVTARRIRQPITSEADIHNAFDAITYPKGSIVLRMIEHHLGDKVFQTAIRTYVAAHADGNAKAEDLFAALDDAAGKRLGALATAWFEQGGIPEVAMDLTCDGRGTAKVTLAQQRFLPNAKPDDQQWDIPLCIAFEQNGARAEQCTVLTQPSKELDLPVCPTWFAPSGDFGYFHAKLDDHALEAIRDHGWDKLTRDERLATYTDASMYARGGAPSLQLVWSLIQKLARDKDELEMIVAVGDLTGNGGTIGLPNELSRATPADLLSAVQTKLRGEFQNQAKALGIAPRGQDTVNQAVLREDLVDLVLWSHSHVLDAEAKALFAKYRSLPQQQMLAVIRVAANVDTKSEWQLRKDLDGEADPVVRDNIITALTSVNDSVQHRQLIESLVADPKLSPEEVADLFSSNNDESRWVSESYLREHLDDVLNRMPHGAEGDSPLELRLLGPFVTICDPAKRDEAVAFLKLHFGAVATMARPIAQGIEQMDNCIARKKLLEPSLRAWLKP
jgi:alanyl aminopeptidase